jgi:hypothetical protein
MVNVDLKMPGEELTIANSSSSEESNTNRLWQHAITEAETSLRHLVGELTVPSEQLIAESAGNGSNGLGAKLATLSKKELKFRDKKIVRLLQEALEAGITLGRRALDSLIQDSSCPPFNSPGKPTGKAGAATASPQDTVANHLPHDLSSQIDEAERRLSAILEEDRQIALVHFQKPGLENIVDRFAGNGAGDPAFDLAGGDPEYIRIIYRVGQDPGYPPDREFSPKEYLDAAFIGITLHFARKLTSGSLERMRVNLLGVIPETPA